VEARYEGGYVVVSYSGGGDGTAAAGTGFYEKYVSQRFLAINRDLKFSP
jgi:hypothetical protein